jgi:acyl-coenzyme A synthetase/AMP-(fatty) acid ligase
MGQSKGHRVATMEVESALGDPKSVAEAAVIGKSHDIKGHAIAAFVTVKSGVDGSPGLMDELKAPVSKKFSGSRTMRDGGSCRRASSSQTWRRHKSPALLGASSG